MDHHGGVLEQYSVEHVDVGGVLPWHEASYFDRC